MYLNRRVYVGANYEHRKITGSIDVKQDGKDIPVRFDKISYIEEEGAYWRKANQIHSWFVDNVQNGEDDCGTYDVSVEKLKELLALCIKVKETAKLEDGKIHNGTRYTSAGKEELYEDGKVITNAEEIAELLPCQGGFFFGSTDYDEYYMRDIESTIEQITAILPKSDDEDVEFTYSSSW